MELLVLLLLILVNGVFVLSEMAVVSARKARLQQWSDEGRAGAGTALALAHSPAHFLSTTQIAITVITILTGALGEATVSSRLAETLSQSAWLRPYANGLAFWLVVVGVAVCALVLGELVPKRLALINPEGVASAMAGPMQLLSKAMAPLVRLMSFVTELVLQLLGVHASGQPPVTEEEINVLMEQGAEAGVFEKHEQAIVSRVFRLDDELITAVMTPRGDIVYFDLNEPFEDNRQKLLRSSHSRFVVCRGGLQDVVGILRAKSLLDTAFQGKPLDFAGDIARPLFVPDTLTMIELLGAFKKHRQHLALVIDEYGDVQGLVTMNDIMEALVGEVASVEDSAEPDIVQRDDGSWLVDGAAAIERFKEAIGLDQELADEDGHSYRTLGGLAMKVLGRVPQVGDRFLSGGLQFEVVDMDQNRVDKLLVIRLHLGSSPPTT
jgi:magnesium and cobalt exporter, CNNM family